MSPQIRSQNFLPIAQFLRLFGPFVLAVRQASVPDRKNERAEQAQKLCDRQKVLASDLRRHRVEKTMFSELDQARDRRLEKATKARTTAEASMEATRARLEEVRDAHAASMKRRDACFSAAGRLRDVGSLIERTRDSACRRRARALACVEINRCVGRTTILH